MVRKLLKSLYDICSSRRLAVGLMVYAAFLVFVATIAQTQIGIEAAKSKFFESFFCLAEFSAVKVPLVGGATVGALAVVNLLASGWRYARGGVYGFGMSIAHMALVLLILSGALQYFMRSEGSVMLTEGAESDTVALRNGAKIKIPFKIKLVKFDAEYWSGSSTPKLFEQTRIPARRLGSPENRRNELARLVRRLDVLPNVVCGQRENERAVGGAQPRAAAAVARSRGDVLRNGSDVPAANVRGKRRRQ